MRIQEPESSSDSDIIELVFVVNVVWMAASTFKVRKISKTKGQSSPEPSITPTLTSVFTGYKTFTWENRGISSRIRNRRAENTDKSKCLWNSLINWLTEASKPTEDELIQNWINGSLIIRECESELNWTTTHGILWTEIFICSVYSANFSWLLLFFLLIYFFCLQTTQKKTMNQNMNLLIIHCKKWSVGLT